jgi:hypothetical protein
MLDERSTYQSKLGTIQMSIVKGLCSMLKNALPLRGEECDNVSGYTKYRYILHHCGLFIVLAIAVTCLKYI